MTLSALGAIDDAMGASRRVWGEQVDDLATGQANDQARGGSDRDPAAVDSGSRGFDSGRQREANDLGRLSEVGETGKNFVALGVEGALVEVRIGLGMSGHAVRVNRVIQVRLRVIASVHA